MTGPDTTATSSGSRAPRLAISQAVLSNGIRVYGYENHATPIIVFRLALPVSALLDVPELAGLASLTASGMNRGTTSRTFAEINEATDGAGMSIGAGSGRHQTVISARCLEQDFSLALGLFADILFNPVFPDQEIAQLKGQLMTGLRQSDNDTGAVASRTFRELCYPAGHPYRQRTQGDLETVPSLTVEHLREFHRNHFGPSGGYIVVGGDFDFASIVHQFDEVLGHWSGPTVTHHAIPDAPQPDHQRRDVFLSGKTQSDLIIGRTCIKRSHPDFYALRIANMILGRLGMMGRLGETVREARGLAYGISSDLDAGIGAGPWSVRAGVNPTNIDAAIDGIKEVLHRFRDGGVTAEELDRAKRFSVGSMALQLETNDGVAGAIADMVLYGLGLDYIDRYPAIVEGLTLDEVNQAASTHLPRFEETVVAVCGPPAA